MKKGIMVLCHSNQEYAKRFIRYSSASSRFCLEVDACSSLAEVVSSLEAHPAELCLVEEAQMAEIRLLEDRLEKNRILVLSAKVYERADREYAAVYQYQPMPELLDQIGKYYLELLPESSGYCLSREMEQEVITVFGFGKEEIRNAYALDTAKKEAQKKRTLYVNMEPVPGVDGQGDGIYELLYYLSQKHAYGGLKLPSLCEQWEGIDRLISPCMLEDYFSLQKSDMELLMTCIRKESDYEAVVFDLGMYMPAFEPVFDQSTRIFLVNGQQERQESGCQNRMERFTKCLEREGKRWIDRMEMVVSG